MNSWCKLCGNTEGNLRADPQLKDTVLVSWSPQGCNSWR